ncbi:fructosamine kinase family protein [Bacillus sonorensis]|uniref:fructosamine kinase family protein n=1 Tax=Bacillus sonorensis TaxID=119858 RepID=UPI00227FDEDF|nr:fructosamine kinase family protein [Bacillus sonorensis]MCY8033262.1 fructosamine kinase family protein [Bacillus sonorensis]MCY8088272.1 fructosamine kinase family protein [Bacillus sonorensis]MCY8402650.1 fructosamine kinase family protein [Bacillus sonorensis]MCY8561708.1 fructosamine kinase family protein [Bacillus sonorensis]MCZ0068216.1 fructosamine kinase family protein [Bacillus sonorensis]
MDLQKIIDQAVESSTGNLAVRRIKEVGGGDINRSFLVETDETRLFIKVNHGVPADFFEKEAMGLAELKQTNAVKVPEVLAYNGKSDAGRFLVLSYIKSTRSFQAEEKLGVQLAGMHRTKKPYYGLAHNNYIGTFQQENGRYDSWNTYYREKRLLTQIKLACEKGFLNERQAEKHIRLAESIGRWLPDNPRSSVLHGDLWGGNWMTGGDGSPYLIDPAVLYGDCQMDLAMTALFGGFTERFYRAYEEASGEALNRDIWPLYQLFYVYMHLNSFGESYLAHTERIVKQYIG